MKIKPAMNLGLHKNRTLMVEYGLYVALFIGCGLVGGEMALKPGSPRFEFCIWNKIDSV